ncbi:SGNH/GDSL hydrolase family protein [Pelagibaculum spongiae]|uniref:SGNH hydrolase-type esterase domain-containing protein n=1 Tax=Pelagibaculum spongiae TaxID=2080658 RepID=A0A2V1GW82_9GAMM|nr:SGNH/GDSL hydrolase family protein [Pelagibaculum spongiae]PVZ68208.1 hypothetical protein DC094_12985 [Pelagibaculum spongiae]
MNTLNQPQASTAIRLKLKCRRLLWQTIWLLAAPLLLVAWWQGKKLKQHALRFPEAKGSRNGLIVQPEKNTPSSSNKQPALCICIIGESPAAGVGIDQFHHSLAPNIAQQFALKTFRQVQWQALAKNGSTLQQLIEQQAGYFQPQDISLVIMGVNDATGLTSSRRWKQQLRQLIELLRNSQSQQIAFSATPALEQFPGMPKPLGWIMGIRSRIINLSLGEVCLEQNCHWITGDFQLEIGMMAVDGFHPSRSGVKGWAHSLVSAFD